MAPLPAQEGVWSSGYRRCLGQDSWVPFPAPEGGLFFLQAMIVCTPGIHFCLEKGSVLQWLQQGTASQDSWDPFSTDLFVPVPCL